MDGLRASLGRELHVTRTSQPQGAVGIDWGNPLTKGLIFAPNATISYDGVSGAYTTKVNGPTVTPTSKGLATALVAASSQYITYTRPNTDAGAFTFFCLASFTDTATQRGLITVTNTSNSDRVTMFVGQTANKVSIVTTVGTIGAATASTTTVAASTIYAVAATWIDNNTQSIWLNGVKEASAAPAGGGGFAPATIGIGARYNASWGSFGNGTIGTPLVWNRALSDSEIKSLSDNPWQIFEPKKIFLPVTSFNKVAPVTDRSLEIDYSNPITRGLLAAATPLLVPTASTIDTRFGIASLSVTDVGPRLQNYPATNGLTLLSLGWRNTSVNTNSSSIGALVRNNNSNNNDFGARIDAYTSQRGINSAITYNDYTSSSIPQHTLPIQNKQLLNTVTVYKRNHAEGLKVWADGAVVGTAATLDKNVFPTQAGLVFSNVSGGVLRNIDNPGLIGAFWDRALSDAEVESLNQNPWQLFKVRQEEIIPEIAKPTPKLTPITDIGEGKANIVGTINYVRTTQPTIGVSTIASVMDAMIPYDVTSSSGRSLFETTTQGSWGFDSYGRFRTGATNQPARLSWDPRGVKTARTFTWISIINIATSGAGTLRRLLGNNYSNYGAFTGINLMLSTTNQLAVRFSDGGVANDFMGTAASFNKVSVVVVRVLFNGSTSTVSLFQDGIKTGELTATYGMATRDFSFNGIDDDNGIAIASVKSYLSAFITGARSDAEIKSLSSNPWQIFKSEQHYLPPSKDVAKKAPIAPRQSKMLGSRGGLGAAQVAPALVHRVRTSQPQSPVWIDWGNPLTSGLTGAILPYLEREIIGGGLPTKNGSNISKSVGVLGAGVVSATETIGVSWDYAGNWVAPAGAMTFVLISQLRSIPGGSRRSAGNFLGGASNSYGFNPSATNFCWVYIGGGVGNTITGAPVDLLPHVHVGRIGSDLSMAQFIDGKLSGAATVTALGSGSGLFKILGDSGSGNCTIERIYGCYVFNRALSDAEIKSLSDNPWQIFQSQQSNIWTPT